jgi:hypothetical protein
MEQTHQQPRQLKKNTKTICAMIAKKTKMYIPSDFASRPVYMILAISNGTSLLATAKPILPIPTIPVYTTLFK